MNTLQDQTCLFKRNISDGIQNMLMHMQTGAFTIYTHRVYVLQLRPDKINTYVHLLTYKNIWCTGETRNTFLCTF